MMNLLRRAHLWLGCFFAPLLIFFVASGWYQTMHPDRRKAPGEAEAFFDRMRAVHADSVLPSAAAQSYSTRAFRYMVAVMAFALLLTTLLGILLAFRFSRRKWPIWVCLVLGVALPVILLWLGQKH
jgi:hypothetical protein